MRELEQGCAVVGFLLVAAFLVVLAASFYTWPVVLSYWPFGVAFAFGVACGAKLGDR